MCSTPRSSSFPHRRTKKRSTPEDYQAYASMLRNASACYERKQKLKKARSPLAVSPTTEPMIQPKQRPESASATNQPRRACHRFIKALLKSLRQASVFGNHHA